MPDNYRLLELALKGLEAERVRIEQEITSLAAQMKRKQPGQSRGATPRAGLRARTAGARSAVKKTTTRRRLTEAGRKRLSELAKKRWAASKKAGKTTL